MDIKRLKCTFAYTFNHLRTDKRTKNIMKYTNQQSVIDKAIEKFAIAGIFLKATIREVKAIAAGLKELRALSLSKWKWVCRLPASAVGVQAEVKLCKRKVPVCTPINGLPALKEGSSSLCEAFINVDYQPRRCAFPVTGSMQGTFASFLTCSQCNPQKDTILLSIQDFRAETTIGGDGTKIQKRLTFAISRW